MNDPLKILLGVSSSMVVTLAMTPLLRNLSRGAGWLDRPDGGRKVHSIAVPPSGGFAIFLGLLAGHAFFRNVPVLVWVAAAIVLGAGMADDLFGLRPWQKLAPQALAGILVLVAERPVDVLSGGFAILWLLLCTNSFNLLDGLDGLASTAGLIAACAMLWVRPAAAGLLAPLAGSLAGFLVFNRPPASVFLGDSGSLLIGFVLGWAAIQNGPGGNLLAPALILAVPLGDTALTLARRLFRGQPLLRPDREHVHHRLLRSLGSPVRALLWLAAASLGSALLALAVASGPAGRLP